MARDNSPIFSSLAGDSDLSDLVQEFVNDLQARMDSMRSAFQANNLPELARLAHQLKGAGGGYGFDILSSAAAELENASKSAQSVEDVRKDLEELIDVCNRAKRGRMQNEE